MIQIAVQSGLILQLCPLISDTSIMAVQHHNNFYVLDNKSKVASKEKKDSDHLHAHQHSPLMF